MAFWSAETLRTRLKLGSIIDPYDPERVKYGAYELSLGWETIITSEQQPVTQFWDEDDKVAIPPGQIAMLITKEHISIPDDAIAFISIKAGKKLGGLINISGFHVDPGFKGRLKFSVYNAGPDDIILDVGHPIFLIWFGALDHPTQELYEGEHQNQHRLTGEDALRLRGELASPRALSDRLKVLEHQIVFVKASMVVIALAIILEAIKNFLEW